MDHPGQDSTRHRTAGAREVLLSSGTRFALMHELRGAAEPTLEAHLARLSPVDLVLVEGYKRDGQISWRPEFNAGAPVLRGFERKAVFQL